MIGDLIKSLKANNEAYFKDCADALHVAFDKVTRCAVYGDGHSFTEWVEVDRVRISDKIRVAIDTDGEKKLNVNIEFIE